MSGPDALSWTELLFEINADVQTSFPQKFRYMATYVYETIPRNEKTRPRRFEVQQKMSDPPLKVDPETGLPVRRVIVGGSGLVTHGASILSMNVKRSK